MSDGTRHPLTPEEIREINMRGPFNHGVWRGRGVVISHEGQLAGRAQLINAQIRAWIEETEPADRRRDMRLLDVGCYDGWHIEQLRDLGLKDCVGVEPRLENIEKGAWLRNMLGLETYGRYRRGGVADLPGMFGDAPFDFVVCVGVLYHLRSVVEGLDALSAVCRRHLFIESIVLPHDDVPPDLIAALEMKDIVYREQEKTAALSAHKVESGYLPGSTAALSLVEVPSLALLKLGLRQAGFGDITVIADRAAHRAATPGLRRPMSAVALRARRTDDGARAAEAALALRYERSMLKTLLPHAVIDALSASPDAPWDDALARFGPVCLVDGPDAAISEILGSIFHAPRDKITLETAKRMIADGAYEDAERGLDAITMTLNADWRSVYRSFFLLWRIARAKGRLRAAEDARLRCMTCNPNFPEALFG